VIKTGRWKNNFEKIVKEWVKYTSVEWKEIKRPETFPEAITFFEFVRKRGEDPQWSIHYYGFGEHFTFWSGYGGFIDFDIDNGTAINWERMKEIIVESAQALYDDIKENKPHLFGGNKGDNQ